MNKGNSGSRGDEAELVGIAASKRIPALHFVLYHHKIVFRLLVATPMLKPGNKLAIGARCAGINHCAILCAI